MGFAEVDVEVRHRHALGIEEALEQEPERKRVEVGDGQRPGDHRASARAAARPDWNIVRLRPFDEVGDDEEVTGEAHAGDDLELILEPLAIARPVLVGTPDEPLVEPGVRVGAELLVLILPEPRKDRPALGRGHRASLGDHRGVGERLGQIGEQLGHCRVVLEPGVRR